MGWKDQLRKASFRGVPFSVDSHEAEFGRRTVTHEYPLRDKPFVEDLGRKARALTVEALVLGADYMTARDRLIAAIEQSGPGKLVHPYLGELLVTVTGGRVRESSDQGGLARITFTCVEAGESQFPSQSVNTAAAVAASAAGATAAAQSSFEARHAVANRPQFVARASEGLMRQALDGMTGAVGAVRGAAEQVAALQRDVDDVKRDIVSVLYAPASAAQALVSNMQQLVRNVTELPRDMLALARTFYRFGSVPIDAASTTSRRAQAVNLAEMSRLVRVVAVGEGARAATGVTFDSYQDALAVRDELIDAVDELLLADPADAVYDALRSLRAAVVRDIAARGADLARLVTWTPKATLPTLVVAQAVYGDASREPELVARNLIRHPLFVPGNQPLEVLADA